MHFSHSCSLLHQAPPALYGISANGHRPAGSLITFPAAIFGTIVLGICNALVRPILFLLTLPLTILTLGLFTFVINALVFYLVAYLTPGFHVDGFAAAFKASILLWIVSWIVSHLFAENEKAPT